MPVITQCNQHDEDERIQCLVDGNFCNQFKIGQDITFTFTRDNRTAIANDQITFRYNNFSDPTSIVYTFVNNKGFFQSFDLIAFIYNDVIALQLKRIFPAYYFTTVERDSYGRKFVKIANIYFVELCSENIYQSACPSNIFKTSFGYVLNYLHFNDNYTSINYNYIQEADTILDQVTSNQLATLSDANYKTACLNILCNRLQNEIYSQYFFYFKDEAIKRTCPSVTGTLAQNIVGRDGFTLGSSPV